MPGYWAWPLKIVGTGNEAKLAPEELKRLADDYVLCREKGDWVEFTRAAAQLNVLGEKDGQGLKYNENDEREMQSCLDQLAEQSKKNSLRYFEHAANMALAGKRPRIAQKMWERGVARVEEEQLDRPSKQAYKLEALMSLAQMRDLIRERRRQYYFSKMILRGVDSLF